MIQKVDGVSVGNTPNGTAEGVSAALVEATAADKFSKPYEEMSAVERAEYRAWKEENDQEFLMSVGRHPASINTIPTSTTTHSYDTKPAPIVAAPPVSTQGSISTPNRANATIRQPAIAPRPPISLTDTPFGVSAVKDELTIPFAEVARFVTSVMGTDFGYISKGMAKSIIALIPKEAALLAINTSKDDAMKFLEHDDKDVRKEAIKKYFDVSDDGVSVVENLLETPGFEVNPWKK